MTTRSYRSTRSYADHMTDGDVYVFLLQVAVLSWNTQQRKAAAAAAAATAAAAAAPQSAGRPSVLKDGNRKDSTMSLPGSSKRTAENAAPRTDWMSLGSIMDLIGSSSREARFPEKLIKRLNDRIEKIIKGQDPAYSDPTIRATFARFYNTFKEDSFQRQVKSNRKIEELILIFVTRSQETLKKGIVKPLSDDEFREELSKQLVTFIRIIKECLDTVHGVPRELRERLDVYSTKLKSRPTTAATTSSSSSLTPGGTGVPGREGMTSPMPIAASGSRRGSTSSIQLPAKDPIKDCEMIRSIGELFAVQTEQLLKDVEFMSKSCTEKAAIVDLKHCVKNINLQASWPGRREDFQTEEAYQQWRSQELHMLSDLMMQMCQSNPELLKTTSGADKPNAGRSRANTESGMAPSEASVPASESSDKAADADTSGGGLVDDEETFGNFTFIPPDPKAYYRRALELCIDYDLEQIKQQPEEEEVSLSILSRQHNDLLKECSLRWRITAPYRVLANLDVIKYKYDRQEVPLDCVSEALATMQGMLADLDESHWARADYTTLIHVFSTLFQSFLRSIYEAFQAIHTLDPEEIQPYIVMTEEIHSTRLVRENHDVNGPVVELDKQVEELKDSIRIMAIHEYTAKTTELFSQAVSNEVVPLVQLLDWIEKGAKRLDKRFPEPIFGTVDPVCHLLEKQIPLFLDDLASMKQQIVQHALMERDALAFDDIFSLYGRVKELLKMYVAFCPEGELTFSLSDWFEPHIRNWLVTTDKKTGEWVNNAISTDRFVPIDVEGAVHSSSIDDLFGALQQPIEFIQSLGWPDKYQNARFLTHLSKTISKSIEMYCHRVEEHFMDEMFPRTAEGQDSSQKQSAWMVKAKQTLQGTQKVEPFHFQETSCVKLNNIEAARLLLDKVYNKIDADKQARVIEDNSPDAPADKLNKPLRYIFAVKIVLGENLQPLRDTSSKSRIDSFVTLSDERGNKIAKTRTIYETPDPRWDEAFDISVDRNMWVAATVWDRKLVGDHSLCGRAFLRLDPGYFGDYLTHELWLDLDTQGRLLTRVSMEGEKDDILFYFGRAFRSLKRAESDMVRTIVDKMSIFIRQCLSRSILKSLVKTSGINLDKALGNVKALYAQALASTSSNASTIPPVEAEAPKKNRPAVLTDEEIEGAIAPLLDYLHECLGTLKSSLSDSQAELVMTKVWKEVLNTIDGILLPPLSDSPSDMSQLSGKEVEVVFKWLSFLRNYFNAYDDETQTVHGVALEVLQGPKYREIVAYTLHHDSSTDALMEACVREMQHRLKRAPTKRAVKSNKSVMEQRSLGTIKKRKQEKKVVDEEAQDNLELILRLLRMRPHTGDFLQQQFSTLTALQQGSGPSPATPRKGGRFSAQIQGGQQRTFTAPIPSVPAINSNALQSRLGGPAGNVAVPSRGVSIPPAASPSSTIPTTLPFLPPSTPLFSQSPSQYHAQAVHSQSQIRPGLSPRGSHAHTQSLSTPPSSLGGYPVSVSGPGSGAASPSSGQSRSRTTSMTQPLSGSLSFAGGDGESHAASAVPVSNASGAQRSQGRSLAARLSAAASAAANTPLHSPAASASTLQTNGKNHTPTSNGNGSILPSRDDSFVSTNSSTNNNTSSSSSLSFSASASTSASTASPSLDRLTPAVGGPRPLGPRPR